MKRNNILIYIFTILNAIYLLYLLCRPYNYPIIGIVATLLFLLVISIYLTKKWFSNINKRKLYKEKRKVILYTILSTLFLITYFCVIGGGIKPFINSYQNAEIVFSKKNISPNFINNMIIDNEIFNYEDNEFYDTLKNKNENINVSIKDDKIIINVKNARSGYIILNQQNFKGIKIKDGNIAETIKLNDESTLQYKIKSLSKFDGISIIRIILSLELIAFISFMLVSYLMSVKNKSLIIIMLVALLIGIYYYQNTRIGILYPDSEAYIKYSFNDVFKLRLSGRVPVYPAIIRIMRKIFGAQYYIRITCLAQYVIWYISIFYLYKLLKLLIKNKRLMIFAIIFYSLMSSIIGWNNVILTESISLSGTIIYSYYVIKYINENKLSDIIKAIILSLILTFHRPTCIILVFFLPIFFIARFIFERQHLKSDLKGFIGSLASIFMIIIYAILFHNVFGIYSITDVKVRQDLYVNMYNGLYKNCDDKDFIKKVELAIANNPTYNWAGMTKVLNQYSLKEMEKINKECRMNNLKDYWNYLKKLQENQSTERYYSYSLTSVEKNFDYNLKIINSITNIITFSHVYIAIILELIIFVYKWIKYKKISWIDAGLFAYPLVIIGSTFIGTCAEFMRTSICAVPFTFIAYILLFERLLDK